MNTHRPIALALLAVLAASRVPPACAQGKPAGTNAVAGVMLSVTRVRSAKQTDHKWEGWGWSDRDYNRAVSIRVDVYNGTAEERRFKVEVYFIAKSTTGYREAFDQHTLAPLIGARAHFSEVVTSKFYTESVQTYRWSGTRSASGGKIEGYIVRLLCDDVPVKVAASSHPLEEIARSPDKLKELLPAPEEKEDKKTEWD